MSISATTGAISGTPTAATTTSFSVKVTDSASQTATYAVTSFVVAPAILTLNCIFPATAQVNVAYTGASCAAGGGTPDYTYSLVGAPAWMSISSTTGAISGTPTVATTTSFSVKVTDSASQTATYAVTSFVVAPATLTLTCTFPPTAEINVAYTGASCTAGGGTPAYTYSLTGSYPAGLSINATTGAISGAPTASGTFSFGVKVADSGSQTATSSQTGFVVAAALTLSCTAATQSVQGATYLGSCTTTGGLSPITLSQSGTLPTGVSFNASTGALSGSTTATGAFPFTIKATDANNQASSKSITVTVYPVLTITTTTLANGIAGISYSAACAATGGNGTYSYAISAGALPTGLSLNASTCAITGPPSASGTFNFSITASDTETTPQTYTQPLSITINPALIITSATVPNGSTNLAYSSLLAAQNGTQPYSWSYTGNLPPGLNLNPAGLISGTPSATGTYTFTAKVTDSGSPQQSATKSFTISISAGLTITTTSLANGIVNSSYSAALSAQNGTAPYTWSLASGSLPGGLSINGSSITGTPNSAATFAFIVKVVDSGSPQQTATQALTITIAPVLTLNTGGFPNGIVGVAYSGSCSVNGGTGTLTFAVISGSLPSGLGLNSTNCNVTGTPASGTAATYNFTIKVTDQGSPQQTATQSFSFTISAGLAITSSATLPAGTIGQTYSYSLAAQNGTPPYTWANTSGTFPPGLTPGGDGKITGTPTSTGTYTFTMKVIDSASTPQTATQQFTLVVNPATLTLSCSSLPAAQVSVPYSQSCTVTGGTQPYKNYSISSGALPGGLTLNATSGVISGTPTTAGAFSFTVSVNDSASTPQTATYSVSAFTVNPASQPAVPTFTFAGLPSTQTPGSSISGASINLTTSSAAWPVTVKLTFSPNPSVAGVSSSYIDPALGFAATSGATQSYSLTIPALTTSEPLPQIAPGTVAGTVNATLTVSGQTGATASFVVPASVPIILAGSVQILNISSSGFDVEVIGNSSTRDLKTAIFTFNAAANTSITGTNTFNVDVSSIMTAWYSGTTSQQYGSQFLLTVPFTFSGSSSAIGSVSVTLVNSVGNSTQVTGTP
jgi:hypothetical protein